MTTIKNNQKIYWQVAISVILLFILYKLNLPFYYIIGLGLLIILLIFLKGRYYDKLDAYITSKLPFLATKSPRARKIIVAVIFILSYILLKQVIFFILARFGIDVQRAIMDSVNQSALR